MASAHRPEHEPPPHRLHLAEKDGSTGGGLPPSPVPFYFEDLSTGEIAKALSLRPGTVRMRLSRGREQLREILKGDYFDES